MDLSSKENTEPNDQGRQHTETQMNTPNEIEFILKALKETLTLSRTTSNLSVKRLAGEWVCCVCSFLCLHDDCLTATEKKDVSNAKTCATKMESILLRINCLQAQLEDLTSTI